MWCHWEPSFLWTHLSQEVSSLYLHLLFSSLSVGTRVKNSNLSPVKIFLYHQIAISSSPVKQTWVPFPLLTKSILKKATLRVSRREWEHQSGNSNWTNAALKHPILMPLHVLTYLPALELMDTIWHWLSLVTSLIWRLQSERSGIKPLWWVICWDWISSFVQIIFNVFIVQIQNYKNCPLTVSINKLPSLSLLHRDCDRQEKGGVDFRDLEVHA